jgi:hypothetical protein
MSYLTPEKWWMKIFNFIAKCQEKSLLEQTGCQVFDIRVCYDGDKLKFAHGLITYKTDLTINLILKYIETCIDDPIVRLILEKDYKGKEKFIELCKTVEEKYPKIKFYGGNYKKTWEKLYNFKQDLEGITDQWVSSMAKDVRWYEKFIPKLYARRMNKVNINNIDKNRINLFDFVRD